MKKFDNGDILIKDTVGYSFEYDTTEKKEVSVVDCIQDAKAAEMALLYLYGVVCKGNKVDGGMFPTNPFSNSDMNDYFDAIMRKLSEREGNGDFRRVPKDCVRFKGIIDRMYETFKKKNADYGNSFSELYEECGMMYAYGHMMEKLKRVRSLMENEAQVKGESMKDSLYDLANYAVLTIMEIERNKEN